MHLEQLPHTSAPVAKDERGRRACPGGETSRDSPTQLETASWHLEKSQGEAHCILNQLQTCGPEKTETDFPHCSTYRCW